MNNTLYITVGLPGSGKSTYAKEFIKGKDVHYLSSDELRAVYGKGEDDQSVTPMVFGHIKRKVDEFLKDGNKIKCVLQLKGRQKGTPERGELTMLKYAKGVDEFGMPETMPKLEGGRWLMMIRPISKKQ